MHQSLFGDFPVAFMLPAFVWCISSSVVGSFCAGFSGEFLFGLD